MKQIYKIVLHIVILMIVSSIGIVASQNQSEISENLTEYEHQTSDTTIPEIEEARLPTSAEEKARFENMLKIAPGDLENRSIQKGSAPTEQTITSSIPAIPSDVSYSNPITGASMFATRFSSGAIYNRSNVNWGIYSFYLPIASYVYIDVSGQIEYVDGQAYYSMYIDSSLITEAVESGSCNSGYYCWLPIQRSRLIYLSKGYHTLYINGYAYPMSGSHYRADGDVSIIAEPEYTAITVTSPNGGESWTRGTTKAITWGKVGQPGANVKIELYKGGVLNSIINMTTPNDRMYSWRIPMSQLTGADYKIKIASTSEPTKYYDLSNNNFRIN